MNINLEAPTDGSGGADRQRKPLEENPGSVVQMATIAPHVARCFESFERFLESVKEKELECSDEITSSDISDAIGRFRVWSSNIGAHKTGRSSLEYRLRDASHIQERVQTLLQTLNGFIEDGTAIVKGEKTAWDKLPSETHTNPNSTDDEPSDSSSDESLGNDTELRQLMTSIKTRITLLMRLSMAIRKPAAHDLFLASTDIDISHFQEYDIRHVREKFPNAPDYVIRRLGVAISKRRQYFKYRGAHARKLAYDPGIEESDGKTEYQLQSTIASSLPQALMSNRHRFDLDEDASSDARASQTSFATSTGHAAEGPRVPPLPRDAREGEPFECPFCFMLVSIRTRKSWKKHVYRDLHPYVCTYPGCHAAHKLFEGCREWFQHEREMHRRYWICQPCCSRRFQDRHDFREHIMNEHDITESVENFIDDSEHATGVEMSASCCLCGETCPSLLQLRNHLGDHQRQLALFALPMLDPKNDNEDDNADMEMSERSVNDSSVGVESVLTAVVRQNPAPPLFFACPLYKHEDLSNPGIPKDCSYTGRGFRNMAEVVRHLKKQHEQELERCSTCSRFFLTRGDFYAHSNDPIGCHRRAPLKGHGPQTLWFDLYTLLFPESPLPPDPYYPRQSYAQDPRHLVPTNSHSTATLQPVMPRPLFSQDYSGPYMYQHVGFSKDDITPDLHQILSSSAHRSPRAKAYDLDKEDPLNSLSSEKHERTTPNSNDKAPIDVMADESDETQPFSPNEGPGTEFQRRGKHESSTTGKGR